MASIFFISDTDTQPVIQTTLTDADDVAINISAYTVKFTMRKYRGDTVISAGSATQPGGGTDGVARYSWTGTNTATPGVYEVEWIVMSGATRVFTAPNDGYDTVVIKDSIA
jgi:hypothetical protein